MDRIKTILRVAWAIVQFPFVYRKLCDQVTHAISQAH